MTKPKEIILILGGARSGKSAWAQDYAEKHYSAHRFLATAQVLDDEMAHRVDLHQKARGPHWKLTEEPLEIAGVLKAQKDTHEVVLIDCITIWLSNVLLKQGPDQVKIYRQKLIEALKSTCSSVIMVSNEVGSGIVPEHPLGRQYRDMAGFLNQKLAETADRVLLIVAGLPVQLKPRKS